MGVWRESNDCLGAVSSSQSPVSSWRLRFWRPSGLALRRRASTDFVGARGPFDFALPLATLRSARDIPLGTLSGARREASEVEGRSGQTVRPYALRAVMETRWAGRGPPSLTIGAFDRTPLRSLEQSPQPPSAPEPSAAEDADQMDDEKGKHGRIELGEEFERKVGHPCEDADDD